jgi:hypothetical protein
MNKILLFCFAVLVLLFSNTFTLYAGEPAKQTQADSLGNTSVDIPHYFKPPVSKEKAPDPNGFIQRWLLLEPIRQSGLRSNSQLVDSYVQRAIKTEYFPNQFTVVPHDGDKVIVNGEELKWHAIDSLRYEVNLFSFASALKKPTYNVVFWAVTVIDCPEEMKDVRLSVGSNSASIWWVNDKEVIDIYGDRHMLLDDGVSKRLTLKKGPNVIRCAVINAPGLSAFCARFLDSERKPIKGFTVNLNKL